MARETAAQKREREVAERNAHETVEWVEFTSTYPARFANLLFRYMSLDYAQFRVRQLEDNVYEFSRTDRSYRVYQLKVTPVAFYSWEYKNTLEQAEELLADYDAEQAEEVRKRTVRAAALNKLSAEERELLNL